MKYFKLYVNSHFNCNMNRLPFQLMDLLCSILVQLPKYATNIHQSNRIEFSADVPTSKDVGGV